MRTAALVWAGHDAGFFDEARDDLRGAARQVVLTFDDGYLHNGAHTNPILERFGVAGLSHRGPSVVMSGTTLIPTGMRTTNTNCSNASQPAACARTPTSVPGPEGSPWRLSGTRR